MIDQKNIPTVLVIFGATGDLMTKKITPALYNLFLKGKLPKLFRIIGVARRSLSRQEFQTHITQILEKNETFKIQKRLTEEFLNYFYYHQGSFDDEKDYLSLAKDLGRIDDEWKVCSNKLFYLSVPPKYYETIFRHLASSGLTIPCGPDEGWTRVLVEKPFGKDLKTAERLDKLLSELFKEEQIYRIDHYLAKEMLQNILLFRFSNNLLEPSWNNKYIERIDIRLHEKIGVEGRGAFYDGLGALRDVGQNHLLQMLALVTMDKPTRIDAECVRENRSLVLKTLEKPEAEEIKHHTFRAQYEGYKNVEGVQKNSSSETYFKVRAFLNNPRWRSVPIYMESGKRFKKALKEIVVTFKPAVKDVKSQAYKNKVTFSLEPNEEITIQFVSKKPGLETELEKRSLESLYRVKEPTAQYVEEYEKLLVDAIEGNQILFLSTEEIEAMWEYIDPIVEGWDKNMVPLKSYKPDTSQVAEDAQTVEEEKHKKTLKKEIGIFGLGKMGSGAALSLLEKGWRVVGYNRSLDDTKLLEAEGLVGTYSIKEFVLQLTTPRVVWLMLPAGKVIDTIIADLTDHLQKGDFIIDAGNSYYKDAVKRERELRKKGINYLDVGFSGGPAGARYGACLMVGGEKKHFSLFTPLLKDLAIPGGYEFFEGVGAGHFVKMIHNGIEYGMMQALGEGFEVLKKSPYKLDLSRVTEIYNNGSVIESRLTNWLKNAFHVHGADLTGISGSVKHTGEGAWTIDTAKELKVKTKVIEEALKFRIESEKNPSFTGKVVSALRNQFGGHIVAEDSKKFTKKLSK